MHPIRQSSRSITVAQWLFPHTPMALGFLRGSTRLAERTHCRSTSLAQPRFLQRCDWCSAISVCASLSACIHPRNSVDSMAHMPSIDTDVESARNGCSRDEGAALKIASTCAVVPPACALGCDGSAEWVCDAHRRGEPMSAVSETWRLWTASKREHGAHDARDDFPRRGRRAVWRCMRGCDHASQRASG